jgi:hypothetical protein
MVGGISITTTQAKYQILDFKLQNNFIHYSLPPNSQAKYRFPVFLTV